MKRSSPGFSLIEVMFVVIVIGILAAIAVPSYLNYAIRGKIPEATSGLAQKRVDMEQFFQDHRTYEAGPACDADASSSQYFEFFCDPAADATSFTLQAVGKGSMAGFTYSIDQSGEKTSSIESPAPAGWIAVSTGCWITREGGVC